MPTEEHEIQPFSQIVYLDIAVSYLSVTQEYLYRDSTTYTLALNPALSIV